MKTVHSKHAILHCHISKVAGVDNPAHRTVWSRVLSSMKKNVDEVIRFVCEGHHSSLANSVE